MMPQVDVVIVAYGSPQLCDRAVQSALALPEVGAVVVVDHGNGEAAMSARRRGAKAIVDSSNPGYAAGLNSGAAIGSAEYLLLMNSDARLLPEGVRVGVETLERHSVYAAVQGLITNDSGEPDRAAGDELGLLHLWARSLSLRVLANKHPWLKLVFRRLPQLNDYFDRVPSAPSDVCWLAATALLCRRQAFQEVGGFSTEMFMYGEDLDFARRLRAGGWKLMALPNPWAIHAGGGSRVSDFSREVSWWRGTLVFCARWWSPWRWRLALGAGAAAMAIRGAPTPRSIPRLMKAVCSPALKARRCGRFEARVAT